MTLLEAVKSIVPDLAVSQRRALEALLCAANHSASAGHLQAVLGLSAVVQVNLAVGQVGKKVHAAMGRHPDGLDVGDFEWWHVLATGERTSGRGFVWTLRPEVVAALHACGFAESDTSCGEQVPKSGSTYLEGAVRSVLVNAYERNPAARARCIEAHGTTCCVCGFDFGAMYGPLAAGLIHVHHLRLLSSIGRDYEVDPVQDLRPVCPNCHAVIHLVDPPYTIEKLRSILGRD